MAWLERRRQHFRIVFRFRGERHNVNLKATAQKEANACLARLEENLRLVERGRLAVPDGADFGLFLLSDGKLEKPVQLVRSVTLAKMFADYQTHFTAGAKESKTRYNEDIHMKHVARILGGETLVTEVTAGTVQQFVDVRSRELHQGQPVKAKTVRKAVATFRFVWNWAHRKGTVPTKFPAVELVFPKGKQPEPFRTYDQIQAILAREKCIDKRRERELWDGLFLDPSQIAEVLEHVSRKRKATSRYLYPFMVTAAHTGARRSELFRARVEDFDFDAKLVHLREKKRSHERETFRTVDMTPFVESVMRDYFANAHPGGVFAFCSRPNVMLTDKQTWKAFLTGVKGSKFHVLRGYHAFRHSFASNLAAAGVDQRVIDELMGHATLEMQKRYRHLFPDQRRDAIARVYAIQPASRPAEGFSPSA
jgi:site-specific recombinase XerD